MPNGPHRNEDEKGSLIPRKGVIEAIVVGSGAPPGRKRNAPPRETDPPGAGDEVLLMKIPPTRTTTTRTMTPTRRMTIQRKLQMMTHLARSTGPKDPKVREGGDDGDR